MKRIRLIKMIHLYVSILVFIVLLTFTFSKKDLNFFDMSLSMLGINEGGWIWNGGILLIAALLYYKIKDSISRFIESPLLQKINKWLIFNLAITAIVNMDHELHNITAFAYFIGVSALIFLFGIKVHRSNFRIGQLSLFIAILSVLLPTGSFPLVGSLAVPETVHITLLFLWLMVLEHDQWIVDTIKKIGF